MDCRVVQEKMLPFINRELKDEELEQFVSHVDSCQDCYEELQISYSLFQGLKMLEQEHADSFHIQHALDTLMQDARDRIRKRHIMKKLIFWFTVTAVFFMVLFFVMQIIRWADHELFRELITFGGRL